MANPFLGVRISPELDEAIAARVRETGQSKSDIVINALKTYLDMMPCQAKLSAIEQRLAIIETMLQAADEQPHASHTAESGLQTHHTQP